MPLILVVDDEEPVRMLLRDTLELRRLRGPRRHRRAEALESFDERRPDGVILDIMMPRMSGIDVLKEIRSRPGGGEVPVILLTAAGDDQTTWDGWSAGATCYLTKPFDPDNLLSWVERLLA